MKAYKFLAGVLLFALSVTTVLAQKTVMEHQSGSKTTVTSSKEGSNVKGEAKNGGQPAGSEKNTGGHKENVDRVIRESKDKGDPVTKVNGKSAK